MAEPDLTFSEAEQAELGFQHFPNGNSVDPLGDVISWLGQVDLAQTLSDKEILGELDQQGKNNAGSARDIIPVQAYLHSHGNASAKFRHTLASEYCCSSSSMSGALTEEDEWIIRQRQTGASGRLVLYGEGDKPREDIHLRGGYGQRVIVTSVTDGGKADQAGVKSGDVLVSIDGRKDFQASSADTIHSSLAAPVILVFMGFVGKLQAEVRLNYKDDLAGVSLKHQIVCPNPDARVHVVDEVFFQPGSSGPVLTTAQASNSTDDSQTGAQSSSATFATSVPIQNKRLDSDDGTCSEELPELHDSDGVENHFPVGGKRLVSDDDTHFQGMYELHDSDAQTIVSQAVLGVHSLATPLSNDNFDKCAESNTASPQASVDVPESLTGVLRHISLHTPANAQAVKGGAAFRVPESGSMRYPLAGDQGSQDEFWDEL